MQQLHWDEGNMGNIGNYLVSAAVFSFVVTFTTAAVADTACTDGGTECADASIANSHCDVPTLKCKCNTQYKEQPAGTCVLRALGEACTAGADAECAGVADAVCKPTDNICACVGKYKQVGAACALKGLTDACSADTDCEAVTGASCKTNCVCAGLYKVDTNPAQCIKIDCTTDADCNSVPNAECTSSSCSCKQYYTEAFGKCPDPGLDDECGEDDDCSAVSNSECVGTPTKTCTCKTSYTESNGQCSAAEGLLTLLSAPAALLLSILTIAITRLY